MENTKMLHGKWEKYRFAIVGMGLVRTQNDIGKDRKTHRI